MRWLRARRLGKTAGLGATQAWWPGLARSRTHDTVRADIESVFGGTRNDRLIGDSTDDFIAGGPDDDIVHGAARDGQVEGMTSRNKLYGDASDDVLLGNDEESRRRNLSEVSDMLRFTPARIAPVRRTGGATRHARPVV